ncbi:acyl-CoA thioesterase [Phaeocystidibacter marisrubri]|uniref:Acyl-CoA thioesterase n=1 Tax=Phaeocystidibacter marisrubri TaxID=1577780 RepID=A0A6L3ZIE8_9FLAO|nr:thioesterase family protein [Phaeocystidibacter marisrubri]KAB2817772.1 acyl-CoA thioesterase [Phaeocystidibacter marisrubri]GGH73625.1 thioesterase [Phaeocystidibacter marisrubri]
MVTTETFVRVRYSETDQMGVVYYGNYAQYYEVGRVELLRELGMSYRALEESGTMLPVLQLECKYIRPARYDDRLKVVTKITELPNTRIRFEHEIYNEEEVLLNVGSVTLVFVNMETNRPQKAPQSVIDIFSPYFINESE